MDIAISLNDIGDMGPVMFFLDSISPDNSGLIKLNEEVEAFKTRLEALVFISKPPPA